MSGGVSGGHRGGQWPNGQLSDWLKLLDIEAISTLVATTLKDALDKREAAKTDRQGPSSEKTKEPDVKPDQKLREPLWNKFAALREHFDGPTAFSMTIKSAVTTLANAIEDEKRAAPHGKQNSYKYFFAHIMQEGKHAPSTEDSNGNSF